MKAINKYKIFMFFLVLILAWGTGCSGVYSGGQESPGTEQEKPESGDNGENPGSEGENPGGSGENPGGEGEIPGGSGGNPPPADPALPEKVYIQVRFDLHDSSGGLYKSDQSREMRQLDYQFDANGTSGTIIDGRATYPPGYYFPYGFIVKYGGGAGASNERIAKYDSGIDYYVGHQGLWVTPKTGGTTTAVVYFVFSFGDQIVFARTTLNLSIPWDDYNPELYTDKALFHIEGTDKKFIVTFEGFEKKALEGSQ